MKAPVVGQHHLAHQPVGALARAEDVLEAALLEARDGGGRDHAAVGDDADPADGEAAAQAVDHGQQHPDIGGVAGHDLRADRPPLGVDDHAQDQLHQVGPVVLGMAALPERLPARALEAQRRGVHEHDRELAEQVAAAREQRLLDPVLDAARGEGRRVRLAALGGVQLLPEPGHGAVEVVQRQAVHTRDGVVLDPLVAGPVGAGDEEPVQDGGEDGALDRELEAAAGEQLLEHRPAAGLLPQPLEQQRAADALAGELIRVAGGEFGKDHRPLGVAGDRAGEAFEAAGGEDGVLAAEVLDDALLGAAVLADALDQVEVGVAVDVLFADEHAGLAAGLFGFGQLTSALGCRI